MPEAPVTPLSLPADCSGLVLFGGTFDPPHLWHTTVARAAVDLLSPGGKGVVAFVPAARSPFKKGGPATSDTDRVQLLRLAISGADLKRAVIWTDELDRGAESGGSAQPSFTIDTLRRLASIVPETLPRRLLIGSDQAAAFHRWREYREVMAKARPAVVLRPPVESKPRMADALLATGFWSATEVREWMDAVVPAPIGDVSSTSIRALLSRDQLQRDRAILKELARWVDPGVMAYIEQRGLYTTAEEA